MTKQYVTEEELPRTETVQGLMQGIHAFCREEQLAAVRGIGSTQTLQEIWVITAQHCVQMLLQAESFQCKLQHQLDICLFYLLQGHCSKFLSFACCQLGQDL